MANNAMILDCVLEVIGELIASLHLGEMPAE